MLVERSTQSSHRLPKQCLYRKRSDMLRIYSPFRSEQPRAWL